MTVSKPCYFGNLLLGIVGVDVNLAYILEDVTYYQDSLASYTFLIDNKGTFVIRLYSSPCFQDPVITSYCLNMGSPILTCTETGRLDRRQLKLTKGQRDICSLTHGAP